MLAPLSTRLSAPAIHYSIPTIRVRVSVPFCSRVRVFHRNFSPKMSITNESISVPTENHSAESQKSDVIVQYVVLRRDLIDEWPLGSIITQGCHASVAAIWSHKEDNHTLDYCSPENIDSMHKVTLEVKGETQIQNLSQKLTTNGIAHKLWIEQPENTPTCLATKPYPKSTVSSFFKNLKLCMDIDQICRNRMEDEKSKIVEGVRKITLDPDSQPPLISGVSDEDSKIVVGVGKITLNPASQPPLGIEPKKRKNSEALTNDQKIKLRRKIDDLIHDMGRTLDGMQNSLGELQKSAREMQKLVEKSIGRMQKSVEEINKSVGK